MWSFPTIIHLPMFTSGEQVKPGQYAGPRVFKEGDAATFACLPAIPLEVGKLFADSPDTTL